ncbi:MAG TPA: hypothetical protein VM802_01405 [Chitinophaga sp.]|uniref:hypothetical protein n=1 Tax=Chitinophaga sp. TaxID=1869181 RepID=UPI002CBF2E6E|nr:hypothetical protein [Chitinophaga sp.]HVI43488.1 hypothetical protein [Chitinophaga sp.]
MNPKLFSYLKKALLPFTISSILSLACRKNTIQDNRLDTISDMKEAFQNIGWSDKLTDPFNDTLSLVWSPNWEQYAEKKSAEGTTFYYVPLSSTLRNKNNTNQRDHINQIRFQRYLVVALDKSNNYTFQRLTYIPQYRIRNRSTGQDMTFNYAGFTGYSIAEDAHGYSKVSYFRTGGLLFEDGRRINNPAANNKSIYAPQAKVVPGFDTVNLWELNPDPGMLPGDPLAGECFTKCFWATTCGDGVWNITRTIAAPKEPCTQPMESACDNDRTAVWRLSYSEKFNCIIPGKDPNAVPLPPGDGGTGGTGGATGTMHVTEIIKSQIKDPCISSALDIALTGGVKNSIATTFNQLFASSTDYEISFLDGPLDEATDGITKTITRYKIEITLNSAILPNTSKEFIVATVLHEAIHALYDAQGMEAQAPRLSFSEHVQHNLMAWKYVSQISTVLRNIFPTLGQEDADAMAWGGLESGLFWRTLDRSTANKYLLINQEFRNKGQRGTRCR